MSGPANVNLIFDNAHCDGLLTKWGFGRDWAASEPRYAGGGWDPQMIEPTAWQYDADVEYIPPLNCLAPAPRLSRGGWEMDDYVVESGLWRVTGTAGYLRVPWLHYYDGQPNRLAASQYGSIYLSHEYPTGIAVWTWRFPGTAVDDDPPLVAIWLMGDGVCPVLMLVLPGYSGGDGLAGDLLGVSGRAFDKPLLCACPIGGTQWTILDQGEDAGQSQTIGEYSQLQQIVWEYLDGCALIRLGNLSNYWCFGGDWYDAEGKKHTYEQRPGPVRIQVCGHPAMFNVSEIVYPEVAYARPRVRAFLGEQFAGTPKYRAISGSNDPTGLLASVTVAEDEYLPEPDATRPVATFVSEEPGRYCRACLYTIQQYDAPEFAAGVSNPVTTDNNAQMSVVEASISLSRRWRGATLQARVEAAPGETLGAIKTNSKVVANLSLDNGATYLTKFAGYVLPQEPGRDGQVDQVGSDLRAACGIEARLSRKTMLFHPSFEGWPLDEAFTYVLQRAGVPEGLIYIDAGITEEAGYVLPSATRKGQRQFQYRAEETPVGALDHMVAALDCEWGYGVDGRYFLRPRLEWDGDTVDFVLEDTPADTADFLLSFRAAQSVEEYINVLVALTECGSDSQARMLLDKASWQDATSDLFIGDDWWHLEVLRERANLEAVADLLWQRRNKLQRLCWFDLHGHPELLPDMFVECRISGCDIPEGTVFRISRDDCRVDAEGELTDSFEAEVVGEVGS